MRCDVNVSVKPVGQKQLGTKVEVKNMNSFSGIAKAIDYEIERQVQSRLLRNWPGQSTTISTTRWSQLLLLCALCTLLVPDVRC